jgi:hypothetical protein
MPVVSAPANQLQWRIGVLATVLALATHGACVVAALAAGDCLSILIFGLAAFIAPPFVIGTITGIAMRRSLQPGHAPSAAQLVVLAVTALLITGAWGILAAWLGLPASTLDHLGLAALTIVCGMALAVSGIPALLVSPFFVEAWVRRFDPPRPSTRTSRLCLVFAFAVATAWAVDRSVPNAWRDLASLWFAAASTAAIVGALGQRFVVGTQRPLRTTWLIAVSAMTIAFVTDFSRLQRFDEPLPRSDLRVAIDAIAIALANVVVATPWIWLCDRLCSARLPPARTLPAKWHRKPRQTT